jgi:hypothetical protein
LTGSQREQRLHLKKSPKNLAPLVRWLQKISWELCLKIQTLERKNTYLKMKGYKSLPILLKRDKMMQKKEQPQLEI